MSAFSKTHVDLQAGRTELHDALGLTGAEVSFNCLPAGAGVPFVHSHKNNEEIDLKQNFDDDDDIGFTPSDDLFPEQNVADDMDGYSVDEPEDDDYTRDDDDMFGEGELDDEDPFDLGDEGDEF